LSSLKGNKPVFIAILLLAVTAASGAPTIASDNSITSTAQMVSYTPVVIVPVEEVVSPIDTKLANLGTELLQPPVSFAGLKDSEGENVKSLPAVPEAIFMVLSGFLCVSLVKNRCVWLSVLAGLLWAGQTGIQALPQLALRLGHGNHSKQRLCAELTYPHYFENSKRLRSDIEGTQYIGLLRHLAGIPVSKNRYFYKATYTYTSQPAIIFSRTGLNPLFVCLASGAERFISFSPAFIFAHLARGPPKLA